MPDSRSELDRQIARRLIEARAKAGFVTATAAAAAMGHPRAQSIGDWEAGKGISVENLVLVCKTYRVSTDWVLGLSKLPDIKGSGGIIDRTVEQAIRDADTIEGLLSHAEQLGALLEAPEERVGLRVFFATPIDYAVLDDDEFELRKKAALARIRKLLQKHRAGQEEPTDGARNQGRDDLDPGRSTEEEAS